MLENVLSLPHFYKFYMYKLVFFLILLLSCNTYDAPTFFQEHTSPKITLNYFGLSVSYGVAILLDVFRFINMKVSVTIT